MGHTWTVTSTLTRNPERDIEPVDTKLCQNRYCYCYFPLPESMLQFLSSQVLNASQSINDLQEDIRKIVENTINNSRNKEIQTLWPLTDGDTC